MKYVFLILIFGCLNNCCEAYVKTPKQIRAEEADLVANEVTCFFTKKSTKKYDFLVSSIGGGGAGGKGLNLLSVGFESSRKLDIPEARKILVDCVQNFLAEINASKDLKQYLAISPFTEENIDIDILFIDPTRNNKNSRFTSPPFLAVAQAYKGNLAYKTFDETDRLERIKEESYEEALEILETGNQ